MLPVITAIPPKAYQVPPMGCGSIMLLIIIRPSIAQYQVSQYHGSSLQIGHHEPHMLGELELQLIIVGQWYVAV